jgi:quinol monooxygenase YgiN
MTYALLNRLTAKPGKRDQVVEKLIEAGKPFDDNPACLLYLVTESADDPEVIWVIDLWTSQDEHTQALQDPTLQPHIAETMPLLEGMPEQMEAHPRGGKGFPV